MNNESVFLHLLENGRYHLDYQQHQQTGTQQVLTLFKTRENEKRGRGREKKEKKT